MWCAILLVAGSFGLDLGVKVLERVLGLLVEDEVFQRNQHFDGGQVFGVWEECGVDNPETPQSYWQCEELTLGVIRGWSSS